MKPRHFPLVQMSQLMRLGTEKCVVTVTNASKAQGGVRYYISLDGKSLLLAKTPAEVVLSLWS